jgi:hypothetical protein
MIDFKQVLRALISGEDFSDHAMQIDVNGELGPRHGAVVGEPPCDFCAAWRAAKTYLSMNLRPQFLVGDEVTAFDRHQAVVKDTREQYLLDAQGFLAWVDAKNVTPARPERTRWSDSTGDIWERDETTGKVLLVEYADGSSPVVSQQLRDDPSAWRFTFERAQKEFGVFIQVKR